MSCVVVFSAEKCNHDIFPDFSQVFGKIWYTFILPIKLIIIILSFPKVLPGFPVWEEFA